MATQLNKVETLTIQLGSQLGKPCLEALKSGEGKWKPTVLSLVSIWGNTNSNTPWNIA